jgi:hypothetical protein
MYDMSWLTPSQILTSCGYVTTFRVGAQGGSTECFDWPDREFEWCYAYYVKSFTYSIQYSYHV